MSPRPPTIGRRRLLRGFAGIASASALAACAAPSPPPPSLDERIGALTERLDPGQRYRPPTEDEARRAAAGAEQLCGGEVSSASAEFSPLGFTVESIHDESSQRDVVVASGEADTERTWGMLVLAADATPPDVLIEVPHPRADQVTEQIGLALLRAVPGSALLVAGAHRRAASDAADVAHRTDSVFHAIADRIARHGTFQLQLHGFADKSLRGKDAVISTGRARVSERIERLADSLDDVGLDVCRAWEDTCKALEGNHNAQGRAAARRGLDFCHLELNNSTRTDRSRRDDVVDALAGALTI